MEQNEERTKEGRKGGALVVIDSNPPAGDNRAIMLHMASAAALRQRTPVAYFSPDTSEVQIVNRLLAVSTGIDFRSISNGMLKTGQWEKLDELLPSLIGAPLWIDDTPVMTLDELCDRITDLAVINGVRLVVIDPVYGIGVPGDDAMQDSQARIDCINRGLKETAEELGITIFAVEN